VGNIKRFRQVNEIFGREAGDALLRELAQRLRASCPERENVARTAGDSFAFILDATGEPAEIVARVDAGLQAILGQPFAIGGKEVRIAMTAGVAVSPPDGPDAETLFRHAEDAKKKAKVTGDRILFYQPEMNARVAETLLLESRLHRALENGEFELYYQPKVAAATGAVTGLEALIRWRDPEGGLVPPAKFIPLLEETGMIVEVGAWVIRNALIESRDWRLIHGGPLRIAVNVSPVQLKQPDFVETVRRAIEGFGSAAAQLDLEITESMAMDGIEGNVKKLRELRAMGINIAVDDFGTGYSSLAYLTSLPISALKIDRSFVATMQSDAQHMSLVSMIISLGRTLDLAVIAEGVETEDQAKLLRLLKCDQLQGYLYSKPLPAAEVAAALERLTIRAGHWLPSS
jgi:diguanylate cyclase (GGDEF)-like protein